MLICDSCKKEGSTEDMISCHKCNKVFHKNANCVKVREVVFDEEKECPTCGQKTKKLNERICPFCGVHLWNIHIDCGGVFQ